MILRPFYISSITLVWYGYPSKKNIKIGKLLNLRHVKFSFLLFFIHRKDHMEMISVEFSHQQHKFNYLWYLHYDELN
jgi:hypothetical protein